MYHNVLLPLWLKHKHTIPVLDDAIACDDENNISECSNTENGHISDLDSDNGGDAPDKKVHYNVRKYFNIGRYGSVTGSGVGNIGDTSNGNDQSFDYRDNNDDVLVTGSLV